MLTIKLLNFDTDDDDDAHQTPAFCLMQQNKARVYDSTISLKSECSRVRASSKLYERLFTFTYMHYAVLFNVRRKFSFT